MIPLRPLIASCTLGLCIAWNAGTVGPVATLLAHHYGTSLGVIGLLTTALFLGELVALVPGGHAVDQHGPKRVGLAAMLLVLIPTLLLLVVPTAAAAIALRFVAGIGIGLGFVAGAVFATPGGTGGGATLAGGIYGAFASAGFGLAVAAVPQLVPAFHWRAPYVAGAALTAGALLIVATSPTVPGHGRAHSRPTPAALLGDGNLIRLGAVAAVSFGFSIILGSWIVTLLERAGGLQRGLAGAIGSLILVLAIVGRPAGAAIVRAAPQLTRPLLAASFVACAAGIGLVVLSLGPGADAAATALIGIACGLPFGVTLAGAARAYPKASGAAVGAVNVYSMFVITIGVPLVGLTFDLAGDGRIGFVALAVLCVAALAVLPRLQV